MAASRPVGARLVSTGEAARQLSVDRSTLHRWATTGLVQPDEVTAGGHMRWDVERLRTELRRLAEERQRDDT